MHETGSKVTYIVIEVDKNIILVVIFKWLDNGMSIKTIEGNIWSSRHGIVHPEGNRTHSLPSLRILYVLRCWRH